MSTAKSKTLKARKQADKAERKAAKAAAKASVPKLRGELGK